MAVMVPGVEDAGMKDDVEMKEGILGIWEGYLSCFKTVESVVGIVYQRARFRAFSHNRLKRHQDDSLIRSIESITQPHSPHLLLKSHTKPYDLWQVSI
jgi:hypothetical protein